MSFDKFHNAVAMNNFVHRAIESDVKRLHPDPRTARVVEIMEGHCMVTYSGEDTIVKVPYNNLAPSHVGQVVLIDGPWDDRRIVEVMGPTTFENRITGVENFTFSPPLWFQSMMEYPETYPIVMTNDKLELGTSWVNASPMVCPRATQVVRVEIRLTAAVSSSTIKLSLYRVNEDFTVMYHVESATVSGNTRSPGFTLNNPIDVAADDLLCVVASKVSGGDMFAHGMTHPPLPLSRAGQFTMGNFAPEYQGNTVTSDLITPRNTSFHMWAIGLPYVV